MVSIMDEIISYKMCAVKVRNAKLRNYLNLKRIYNLSKLPYERNKEIKELLNLFVRILGRLYFLFALRLIITEFL